MQKGNYVLFETILGCYTKDMQINTLLDKVRKYLSSPFYPVTIGLIAFLTWISPSPLVYLPASIYALFCFLPLLGKEGKCYLPLFLFEIVLPNDVLGLNGIPGEVLLTGIALILSCIVFVFINKPKLIKGDLFYTTLILVSTFLVSYIYNMIKDGSNDYRGILYIVALYLLILISIFFFTALGRGETLPYFSYTVACLDVVITLQIIFSIFLNMQTIPLKWKSFNLGWALDSSTASTILCLSLPFLAMNTAKKKYSFIAIVLVNIVGILLISSGSGLLCLLFSIVPIIFLSFKTYENKYPYFVLLALIVTGSILSLLIGLNQTANTNIINALKSLNPLLDIPEGRLSLYKNAADVIRNHPVFGVSIAGMATEEGIVQYSNNNVLTTMSFGGVISLLAYVAFEVNLYYISMKKKTGERALFLVFLLEMELIGYVNDSLYLLPVLLLILIANAVYQTSNRPQDAIVHQDFFERHNPMPNMDRR